MATTTTRYVENHAVQEHEIVLTFPVTVVVSLRHPLVEGALKDFAESGSPFNTRHYIESQIEEAIEALSEIVVAKVGA